MLGSDEACATWTAAMQFSVEAYSRLLTAGVSPQFARSVLPNSLKTEIVMTANFREWLLVLSLRGATAAHPQMRCLMGLVRRELTKACPEVFAGPE